jgi:HEAT repeat protein
MIRKTFVGAATIAGLTLALAGCSKSQPITSGGRTASYWAEVLQQPSPDVAQRRKAAEKLGPLILIDKAALPALIAALKDQDAGVRSMAARSLGIYSGKNEPSVLTALRAAREEEADKNTRDALDKAIGRVAPDK